MVKPRKPPTPVTERLKAERIQLFAREFPRWELNRDQTSISRVFHFPGLRAAAVFAALVAEVAEHHHHTAALLVDTDAVTVTLTTREIPGLTERDLAVATGLEALA